QAERRPVLDAAATGELDLAHLPQIRPGAALPPAAITIRRLDLSALSSAGLLPRRSEGVVSGVIAVSEGRLHGNLSVEQARLASSGALDVAVSMHSFERHALLALVVRDPQGGQGSVGISASF